MAPPFDSGSSKVRIVVFFVSSGGHRSLLEFDLLQLVRAPAKSMDTIHKVRFFEKSILYAKRMLRSDVRNPDLLTLSKDSQ